MATRLADRLRDARHRWFVGRAAELALFRSAIEAGELPFALLYVFGPGGVGKTALLHEFVRACNQSGVGACSVDARTIEPSPEAFTATLQAALDVDTDQAPLALLASRPGLVVLMVDTYERLHPIDGWLRDSFLPDLSDNVLVVLASRQPPAAWLADTGWHNLVRTVPLRNPSPDESLAFLSQHEIPRDEHAAIQRFTHGHPLALALVAELFAQRPDSVHDFQPGTAPDVITTILERLVQRVPGPAHRTALEACAMVRVMTESLLAQMLTLPDAHELFDWLRGLSFVETRQGGLFPHDLVREVLAADLRWRNPDWYAELHRRARTYYTARLQQVAGRAQQRTLLDLVYLHRDSPAVRPFFEWQTGSGSLPTAAAAADVPALVGIVRRHEGDESARIAAHWLGCRARDALVFRDAEGQVLGMLHMIALHDVDDEERGQDPAVAAAWSYLERRNPLRSGEAATLFRFWMAHDSYQAVSPIQSLIFITMVRHYLTTPNLAFTFIPCADPGFWAPMFAYADLARLPQADFEVGGRRYGVYGHDWREVPPATWLQLLTERETAEGGPAPPSSAVAHLIVLSRDEFELAVRDALANLSRADLLRGNPLLRSRLVAEHAGTEAAEAERARVLQALVRRAAETLQATPRQMKGYRALYHTYFQPAPTQEIAAGLLDLPYSTFRRHLKAGIDQVATILWQQEVGSTK